MFNFFKRKKHTDPQFRSLPFKTDLHSHILPGLDDGSPDIETSLQLIKGLYDLGVRRLVATPHIIGDIFRNNEKTISTALQRTQIACEEAEIGVTITAAAEYMLDDYFLGLLRTNTPLMTIHDNVILTEVSYTLPNDKIEQISFTLQTSGYKAILAHPERYSYLHRKPNEYYRLKELGFMLQLNALSLTGYYGNEVTKAAKFLLAHELIDIVSSDLHHMRHLNAIIEHLDKIAGPLQGKTLLNDQVVNMQNVE
jgi:protein-tyrosine phosphatase